MNRLLAVVTIACSLVRTELGQAQNVWPALQPIALQQDNVTLDLAGNVQDVAVGAAGRMLVFRLEGQNTLSVVDLQEVEVVGTIPLPWPSTLFAAGLDSIVLVDAEEGRAERWSLRTLTREAEGRLDATLPIGSLAMGSASRGPLLAMPKDCRWPLDEVRLIDPHTFEPAVEELQLEGRNVRQVLKPTDRQYATAAANGLLFHTAPTQFVVRFEGTAASGTYYRPGDARQPTLLPGPLADAFYGLDQPLTPEFEPAARPAGASQNAVTIPDHNGPFYLRFEVNGGVIQSVSAFLAGSNSAGTPLAELGISNIAENDALPLWKRVHLLSAAHVIALCDPEQSVLRLVRFVPEQILEATGSPYLAVVSQPAAFAQTGETFNYTINTISSAQDVRYEIEQGPDGAAVSPAGQVKWNVAPDFAEPLAAFSIRISDDQDLVQHHRFSLRVFGADPKNAKPRATLPGGELHIADTMRIVPPDLGETPTVVPLKSTASSVAVGGGGRFLILKLVGQVAVFDVNQAAVIGYVPLPSTKCLVTAGAESLVIFDPDATRIERWNLSDLSLGKANQLQINHRLPALTMGSAATSPIVLGSPGSIKDIAFIDGETLEPLPSMISDLKHESYIPDQVRVSADGRVVTAWRSSLSPSGFWLVVREGPRFVARYAPVSCGSLLPSPDGQYILTSSGVFTSQLRPASFGERGKLLIPAVRGPFYLAFQVPNHFDPDSTPMVTLHVNGETRALAEIPALKPLLDQSPQQRGPQHELDRRLWFIPDAKLVVHLSGIGNQLTLYRVDVEAFRDQCPDGYLFVESLPPREARPGDEWTYHVSSQSKHGGLRYRLAIGPTGMTIDGSGQMSWQVLPTGQTGDHHIIVAVQDRNGREVLHAFDIFVSD